MVVFFWALVSQAQTPIVTTAATVTTCPGSTNVIVPFTVQNFNSVASISLKIDFDIASLTYVGYTVHPALTNSGATFMINSPVGAGNVSIASFGLLEFSVPDGEALFTITFNVNSSSNLVWNMVEQGACSYSNLAGSTLPADFINGAINTGLPDGVITSIPFICSGQPAEVSIDVTTGNAPFILVYNDGVNPNDTVITSDDPYTFIDYPTAATTYSLVSITAAGGCTNNAISSSCTTSFFPAPAIYNVIGGGSYCNSIGVQVGLDGSQAGVVYELYLDGVTTGQYWSGTGLPLSLGTHTTYGVYTVIGANDCGTIDMQGNTTVSAGIAPLVTLDAFPAQCLDVPYYQLTGGLPAGGEYSGFGVADGVFYPSTIGTGTYTITYTYTDAYGCTGFAESTIEVLDLPVVSFDPIPDQCQNGLGYTLTGTPEGGQFSGAGVDANIFNPQLLEPGYYTLSYSYTDLNGCTNHANQDVLVLQLPYLEIYLPDQVCEDIDSVELTAYPEGGTFSGGNVSGNYFHPHFTGGNIETITYTYTDGNGCTNTISGHITVNPIPDIIFNPIDPVCVSSEYVLLQASPAGGYFEGYNVYQNGNNEWYFLAYEINPGIYDITYYYTNEFGCQASVTQSITVNPLPEVSINPFGNVFCNNSEAVQLTGNPAGGVFSGAGVSGDYFHPSTVAPGFNYDIIYTYVDQNGCSNSTSVTVFVSGIPELHFTVQPDICVNSEQLTLDAYPTGGTYTGTGVTGSTFDPAVAGPGIFYITYEYTDENGCSNSIYDTITVHPAPQPAIIDLPANVCLNADMFPLNGTPAGGIFSGPAVWFDGVDYFFHPESGYLGNNVILYTVTNEFGCFNSVEGIVLINSTPVVSIESVPDLCIESAPQTLVGIPSGGTFSGAGVVGNTFNPAQAIAGANNEVTYNYTDQNGCSGSATIFIWVNTSPFTEIYGISDLCASSDPVQLDAYPAGGVFSGSGVVNNTFDPSIAGIGLQIITYTYTDQNGCIGTDTDTVEVFASPNVSFEPVAPVCENANPVELFASPAGGWFEGPGVVGNIFYPSTAGAGTYTLSYIYDAGNNCTGSANQEVTVLDAPVVTLDPLSPVCIDGGTVVLNGIPAGGVYSGTGVTGDQFNPAIAGVGTFVITYTYNDQLTGCSGIAGQEITVIAIPEIYNNPVNMTVNAGDNASFSINSYNANFFQWQVSINNGGTWNNISDDLTYSGTSTETLNINNAGMLMNGYMYQCMVFGDCPTFVTSTSALLTVESNSIEVTAGIVENCAGEILVPVNVANFYNVATISLTLNYDTNILTYVGYNDLNPALANGIYSVNAIGNQVKLGYFSLTPASFGNGLLINYIFTSAGGYTDLTWDLTPGNCVFTDFNEINIPGNYNNGSATVNPLPVAFNVMGGGTYCFGSDGLEIYLDNSETGVTYSLYRDNVYTGMQLAGTGGQISFGIISATGTYHVSSINTVTNCTNTMNGTVSISVNNPISIEAGDDATIFEGSSTQLNAVVNGGTGQYTYSWTPVDGLDNPAIANPVASPEITTTYTVVVTDVFGCQATDFLTITVIQLLDQLSGVVSYDNASSSPMANVPVDLYTSANTFVASTITGPNGEYEFTDLDIGTYYVVATTTKQWGGGNAVDGLLMIQHFVGNQLLSGLPLIAGDVTGNGVINGLDGLNTLKRFAGLLPSFAPVPDWYFESPTVIIDGLTAPVADIKAICYGDVNGDYLPPYIKPEPTISLNSEGSVDVVDGQAILPVISTQDMTIGAISFVLEVPSNVIVNNVSMNNGDNNLVFNQNGNELRIGWYNVSPIQVNAGQTIMNLSVNVLGTVNNDFTIDGYSVIADEKAQIIRNTSIVIPKLAQSVLPTSLSSYPNPFSSNATITYSISETGNVNLRLFNIIGEQVLEFVNSDQEAGSYTIKLNSDMLPQGAYILKMETNGNVLTKMINVIK